MGTDMARSSNSRRSMPRKQPENTVGHARLAVFPSMVDGLTWRKTQVPRSFLNSMPLLHNINGLPSPFIASINPAISSLDGRLEVWFFTPALQVRALRWLHRALCSRSRTRHQDQEPSQRIPTHNGEQYPLFFSKPASLFRLGRSYMSNSSGPTTSNSLVNDSETPSSTDSNSHLPTESKM